MAGQQAGHCLGIFEPGLFHVLLPLGHLGKEGGQHLAAFLCCLLVQLDRLFGFLPLELGEAFHLLLGKLYMGHRGDRVVACDGQQALVCDGGMVDLDVGEFGNSGCLEQPGIIQPGAVEGEKVQLAALQGGQHPARCG